MKITYYPRSASSWFAIGVALAVLGILNRMAEVTPSIVALGAGLAIFGVGIEVRKREYQILGIGAILASLGVIAAALTLLVSVGDEPEIAMFAPGIVGSAILAAGVFPVRGRGSQMLVKLGAAGIFISVLVAGIYEAPLSILLVGGVGSILAWDAGDHAITLGEQMGMAARTIPVEVTHLAGTILVGTLAVVAAYLVRGIEPTDISLAQFIVLLGALLLLTLALHE